MTMIMMMMIMMMRGRELLKGTFIMIINLVARLLFTHRRRDSTHSSRESLPQTMPTHQPLVSEFINISYAEVGVS